uniref:Beta-catenin-like protein 1 N-terminal domain-containing protein n=1 Tax=Pseudonaja textilis TaxID=8673 RepID=A0A670ZHE7_PSETE
REPNRGTKRTREDEEEELKTRHKPVASRERGRYREEEPPAAEESEDEKKKLLHIIERGEEEEEEEEPLDESSVKKMILTFEKRSYKNQELRIKFPDNPEKPLIYYLPIYHLSLFSLPPSLPIYHLSIYISSAYHLSQGSSNLASLRLVAFNSQRS